MSSTETTALVLGTVAPHFALHGSADALVCVDDFWASRGLLVAFVPEPSPASGGIDPDLVRIAGAYLPGGIATVVIRSSGDDPDSAEALDALRREHAGGRYGFPILLDETHDVTRAYGVTRTPDFFLFGPDRKLVYHGQSLSAPGFRVALDEIAHP